MVSIVNSVDNEEMNKFEQIDYCQNMSTHFFLSGSLSLLPLLINLLSFAYQFLIVLKDFYRKISDQQIDDFNFKETDLVYIAVVLLVTTFLIEAILAVVYLSRANPRTIPLAIHGIIDKFKVDSVTEDRTTIPL